MNIMTIVSIALGAILLIGFLIGFLRSWQKSLVRFALLLVCFAGGLLLSNKIAEVLMNKYVDGLVVSIFGQTIDFEAIAGDLAGDLVSEGSAMTTFATALLNIAIKLVSFLIIFISLMIVTLVIYYIISAIISSKQKKKAVGRVKAKGWERLIGGLVGMVGSLIVCLALFTPVFGAMNVCDKFLEDNTANASAVAYVDDSLVCGKFYTEDENIGKVETYLEKYDKLRNEYNKSFAGYVFKFTGVDKFGKMTFNNLSTVTQNGVKVNFTTECVNLVKVYNVYKQNFIETKFDLSTEKGVEAIQKIYSIAKNSEVMKNFIVDLVPKMAQKWSNGEKFMGVELPVSGDLKDIVVEMLGAFNSTDFEVLDRNINVAFEAIKIANRNDVISSINNGAEITDVIDKGTFVEDEIKLLATSPEFKRALPNVMTTTVKIAYKSAIGEPGTKLDQEFTQEQTSSIIWNDEAKITQTIITKMFKFFDSTELIDNLTDFGVVIDASRQSKVLSKPVRILMNDYIDQKVDGLNSSVKTTLLSAFNEDNWNSATYSYTNLFATVQTTAKVAKDLENTDFTDLSETISSILENGDQAKDTIKDAVNAGVLNDLIGDEKKADIFKDMINEVLDNTNEKTVDKDLRAGQVIVDIISNQDKGEGSGSVLDNYGDANDPTITEKDKADVLVETITASDTIMNVMKNEADKVDAETTSPVQDYINGLSENDKLAISESIKDMNPADEAQKTKQETLAKLFGIDLTK